MKTPKPLKYILDEAWNDPKAKIAFDDDGYRIMYTENGQDITYKIMGLPTERCYELAIKVGHNPDKIEIIKKLHRDGSEEYNLETVKRSGMFLKFVQTQTPEICLEALNQNKEALDYVKIVDFIDLEDCIKKLQNKIKIKKLIKN